MLDSMPDKERRVSEASVALICRREQDQPRWLARWNRNWQCYYFIGGHRHDDETFRECLEREMQEELAVLEGIHYTVSDEPIACIDYVAESGSAGVDTQYILQVFDVRFPDDAVEDQIDSPQQVRWLAEKEIRACRSAHGELISETMAYVLARLDWRCAPAAAADS